MNPVKTYQAVNPGTNFSVLPGVSFVMYCANSNIIKAASLLATVTVLIIWKLVFNYLLQLFIEFSKQYYFSKFKLCTLILKLKLCTLILTFCDDFLEYLSKPLSSISVGAYKKLIN